MAGTGRPCAAAVNGVYGADESSTSADVRAG